VYYTLHMSMRTLERERQPEMWVITTDLPSSASQQFTFTIDLHFNASFTIITELAGELPAVLPDGPEGFTGPRLTRRDLAVGRVEGLVAHHRSSSRLLLECGEVSGLAGEQKNYEHVFHNLISLLSKD
jgi:hypothetical protein